MSVQAWTFVMVALSFALYIGVALWSKARTTGDFYVAGKTCISLSEWQPQRIG